MKLIRSLLAIYEAMYDTAIKAVAKLWKTVTGTETAENAIKSTLHKTMPFVFFAFAMLGTQYFVTVVSYLACGLVFLGICMSMFTAVTGLSIEIDRAATA